MSKQFKELEKDFQETKHQLEETSELISQNPQVIHIFDREGDIAEVFNQVGKMSRTGVIIRAAHNRSLDPDNTHLWE